jgi:hypothetical protein
MTFHPRREGRWQYAAETVEAVEQWNCSKGHGCTHGAEKGSVEWEDFGPGGTCHLLALIFLQEKIEEMDDDGKRVTCRSYDPRPDPRAPVIPEGQMTIGEAP